MSNPNPPGSARRAPGWLSLVGVLALAGYAILLARNTTVAAGGSDSSGYLNSARLFATGRIDTIVRVPPQLGPPERLFRPDFQPLGFIATAESSRMVPSYPAGFPLHLAVAGKIFGWTTGPLIVGLAAAIGAVWLCYLVGRELGLGRPLAAAGAVALAASPIMLWSSIQPMSDTLATAWCLAAVWTALRARRRPSWAIATGLAYAIAVLVRPTNLVLLPALVVLLGCDWRRLALAIVSGAPVAVALALYNHSLYGGAFRSGYPALETAFAASYVAPSAANFLHWLAIFLPTLLLALPFAALARRDTRTRELLALALWFGAITTVYLFYAISQESWTCLRFILPAMPALVLAGLLGVEALARTFARFDGLRFGAALLVAAWAVDASWRWAPPHAVFFTKRYEDAYTAACLAAREKFPPGSLVVTWAFSGAVYYYTDFPILRWDLLSTAEFADLAAKAQRAGVPVYGMFFSHEEDNAFHNHCPGDWTRLALLGNVGLWQLGPMTSPAATK